MSAEMTDEVYDLIKRVLEDTGAQVVADALVEHAETTVRIDSRSGLDSLELAKAALEAGTLNKAMLEELWHAGRRADELQRHLVILVALGLISPAHDNQPN